MPESMDASLVHIRTFQLTPRLIGIIVIVLLLVSLLGTARWYVALNDAIHPDPTLVRTLQDNVIGSLRYCIENAPPKSTIHFDPSLYGTIHLRESLSFLSGESLTIQGSGASKITISGGNNTYASIQVPSHAVVTISGLSFKDSVTTTYAFLLNAGTLTLSNDFVSGNKTIASFISFGGGIENATTGTLNVQNSTISNNLSMGDKESLGGGINNDGTLNVRDSRFLSNSANSSGGNSFGGGITNSTTGTVTITSSNFSSNSTNSQQYSLGGGISNDGTFSMFTSTISNNRASSKGISAGGAINNDATGTVILSSSTILNNMASGMKGGLGGGIATLGNLNVAESTFWNNAANGGNDFGGGGISFVSYENTFTTIHFCTFYGNTSSAGGGVWIDPQSPVSTSSLTIGSSIIAANKASNGPDISGTLTSSGHNLLTDVSGATGLDAGTDRQATLSELKLDTSLRSNGGPTQTLAMLPGSPAIDAVPLPACSVFIERAESINTDQRLRSRPDDSERTCDIGAYESSY